jgi:hypothetical protein
VGDWDTAKDALDDSVSGDRWPDEVRLSDIEPRFTCKPAAGEALMSVRTSIGRKRRAPVENIEQRPKRYERSPSLGHTFFCSNYRRFRA